MQGALRENGPCFVADDSNSTYLNPWSWNNEANVLYVDQPLHTGFSYTKLRNVTWFPSVGDLGETYLLRPDEELEAMQNATTFVGTVSDRLPDTTVNSTGNAMRAMWDFLQIWLADFPGYQTQNDGINIWGESYAGHYLPALGALIASQNTKIAEGKLAGKVNKHINLRSVGIINGCVDYLHQARAYPEMAFNNTYGIRLINESFYNSATGYFDRSCSHDIVNCQELAARLDPEDSGNNPVVNEACNKGGECDQHVKVPSDVGFGGFDIAHTALDPFPPTNYFGFLNQRWVQQALGVPLNSSLIAFDVAQAFSDPGDFARGGFVESLGALLDQGVSVTLIEQCGNLSFARVYQAGHEGDHIYSQPYLTSAEPVNIVPAYQPETAFAILSRALHGADISTGESLMRNDPYCTTGPLSTWHIKNKLPPPVEPRCYILDPLRTCTGTQIKALNEGRAMIKDFVVVDILEDKGAYR
ncbi:MAG: hypothetical protein Q9226_001804 [Calogaya cf. arnoldii]